MLHIDFETYSECNLKKHGLYAYASHPSTEILCLGWAIDDTKPQIWVPGDSPFILNKYFREKGNFISAFNANFERMILKYCGKKAGLVCPADNMWVDTQAIARMCGLPGSLKDVAEALRLPQQKDTDGYRLIRLFSIPQDDGTRISPFETVPRGPHEWQRVYHKEFRLMEQYCMQDVEVDRAIHHTLPIQWLPFFEQKVWIVDATINERGIPIDINLCISGASMASNARAEACAKLPAMTRSRKHPQGMVRTIGQRDKILEWSRINGYPMPGLNRESVNDALEDPLLPGRVRDVLELRQEANITSLAKFKKASELVEVDGRIRGNYIYHKAGPGRWASTGVQFQNGPRPVLKLDDDDLNLIRRGDYESLKMLYSNPMHVLRDSLRSIAHASPGKTFAVVDAAAIEARVLGWLANCKLYQEAWKTKKDLYKTFASVGFGVAVDEVTSDQRFTGKQIVLSSGYQAGPEKVQTTCKMNKLNLSLKLVEKLVSDYRQTFYEIPQLWKNVQIACLTVVRNGMPFILNTGNATIYIKLTNGYLEILLPSGRSLWYPEARIYVQKRKDKKSGRIYESEVVAFMGWKNGRWCPDYLYGGKTVENMVQGISRDLLAQVLVACEDADHDPIMHAHDEVVCEVWKGEAQSTLDFMINSFCSAPKWGNGLILGAEGFISDYYKKG
jgi:DNA polymerase bacteriophage-type